MGHCYKHLCMLIYLSLQQPYEAGMYYHYAHFTDEELGSREVRCLAKVQEVDPYF